MAKRVKSEDLKKLLSRAFEDAYGKDYPNISKKYRIQIDSISAVMLIDDNELAKRVDYGYAHRCDTRFSVFEKVLRNHAGNHLSFVVVEQGENIIFNVEYDIVD